MKKFLSLVLSLVLIMSLPCVSVLATDETETVVASEELCTRAMMVTALYRAEGEPAVWGGLAFEDVESGSDYEYAVAWAKTNGIVNGVSESRFAPNDNITREQIATIVYRYAIYKGMDAVNLSENLTFTDADEISEYANSALNWATQTELIKGYEDNTVRPQNNVTRAETEAILQRFMKGKTNTMTPILLYQGHGSVRIETPEGKVIYIDPYAGEGYDLPADLILVTHGHGDHNKIELIENRNDDCVIITHEESNLDGEHQSFDLGYVKIEAVEAENKNHNIKECVGYILTFSNGKQVYFTGDTSTTNQMSTLAEREIDYAFYCCDGKFNMDRAEAEKCAELVGATYNIPYHMAPGSNFDRAIAEEFDAPGRIILEDGQTLEIK